MRSYRFPLEQVLDIRKNVERQRQNEFAQSQRIVDENVQILEQIHNHQQESQQTYGQQQMRSADSCIQHYSYFCTLERKMTQQIEHIRALEEETAQKQNRLEAASREKLVIEELKKDDFKRFQQHTRKLEQKHVDEVSTITYNYRRRLNSLSNPRGRS